jgi:hypothetical protein
VIPEFGARVRTQGTAISVTVDVATSLARHAP